MSLEDFLEQKPLYYTQIDYTRMPRAYESIKEHLHIPKVIHIVGTNGKGTTGRFIANALFSLGLKVGHYTSPHIQDFNERIWLNGKNCADEHLEEAHQKLLSILPTEFQQRLSYFEYTTFLAIVVYENCDYIVLEAGLGGEFDATAVFPKVLTLVTPIDIDHEAFLGNTIEEIAATKLNAIQNSAILAAQKETQVYSVANLIAQEAALASLDDTQHIADSVALNDAGLKQLTEGFTQLGLTSIPSIGNFISVDIQQDALPVYNALLQEGIIVRPVANYQLPNHLRITVGTEKQNTRALTALAKVLKGL